MDKPTLAQATKSAISLTKKITTRWTSRLVGSEACLACADYLAEQFSSFCDRTNSEEFSVRPGAFLGYIRINIVLYFIALIGLFFQQIGFALFIANFSLLITVLEFFFYKEFVDFLYPAKSGKNAYGTIEPSGEVKQQIIVSAHHDSAHIFNLLEKDPLTYDRKVLSATLTQFGFFLISWVIFLFDVFDLLNTVVYWGIISVLILASYNLYHLWFFYDKKRGTPGAGDNMVCVAIAMEIGKYFAEQKKKGNQLAHTKIIIASWDAEECGLRGARAFTKQHENDLLQTKTYNFNLECMYDHSQMHFLDSDLNGFVPLSKEMAAECSELSQKLGYDITPVSFPLLAGGTDAAEFAKKGVEATTLVAMNWQERNAETAYHTTRDTIEAIDEEAVKRSIEIGIQYIVGKEKEVQET